MGVKIDGAQARYVAFTLKDYVRLAYMVKDYQVEGPDWMTSARFDISGKMPEGSSRTLLPAMLQNLLEERFGLKLHRSSKEFPVYALVIAKTGLKMKPTEAEAQTLDAPLEVSAHGSAAGTTVSFGPGSYFNFGNNRFEGKKLPFARFSEMLSRFTDLPVIDMTDL